MDANEANRSNKSYRHRLISELALRQTRNPAYSLRSFARDLNVSPSTLSQALNSKRDLSKRNLLKIAERLAFTPQETKIALREVHPEAQFLSDERFTTVREDTFRFMADWYYFAILSLARAGHAVADPEWISERFGITRFQAADAIERLIRLGLIEIVDGKINYDGKPLRTETDTPSSASRNLQHNHMKLAAESLERDPINLRDMTSMTVAIQRDRIPKAKELIKRFRRRLSDFLEGDGKGEDVYVIALQLFPVTKVKREE